MSVVGEGVGMLSPGLSAVSPMDRCLIVVARDRLDLLEAFASRYGQAGDVEIRLDQRTASGGRERGARPDRRAPPNSATHLPDHGFLVIPRL